MCIRDSFLGLHAIHLPVGHLAETYFISYMMLDGHGIDTPDVYKRQLLLMGSLLLGSCQSVEQLSIDYMLPAEVSFPATLKLSLIHI